MNIFDIIIKENDNIRHIEKKLESFGLIFEGIYRLTSSEKNRFDSIAKSLSEFIEAIKMVSQNKLCEGYFNETAISELVFKEY